MNKDSHPEVRNNLRHLVLRSTESIHIMRVRSRLLWEIRKYLYDHHFEELTPPTLVKNSCEGGCKMFPVKFYEEDAFLTESSQLYLETGIQALGNVFCILPSYRAEKTLTRRHLSEFTHFEAEMPFFTFEDLLTFVEDLLVVVTNAIYTTCQEDLKELKSPFQPLKKGFKRMKYRDAITWLKEHNIEDEETKKFYEYGDDIPEKPERFLVDTINEPILLMRFPTPLKAFYMQPCEDDDGETESVDVLVPSVGEIMGGSMRIYNYELLMERYKTLSMDEKPLYWYNDLRKYGTCPHGGFGFGIERILCWICNIRHIRDSCMFPRYMGRITP